MCVKVCSNNGLHSRHSKPANILSLTINQCCTRSLHACKWISFQRWTFSISVKIFLFFFCPLNQPQNSFKWKISSCTQKMAKFEGAHSIYFNRNYHILQRYLLYMCKMFEPEEWWRVNLPISLSLSTPPPLSMTTVTVQTFMLNSFIKLWKWINESYLFRTWHLNACYLSLFLIQSHRKFITFIENIFCCNPFDAMISAKIHDIFLLEWKITIYVE